MKRFVFALLLVVLLLTFVACDNINRPDEVGVTAVQSQTTTNGTIGDENSTSTTHQNSNVSTDAKRISDLMSEDGIGEFAMGESVQDFMKILDKYDIKYEYQEGNGITLEDGSNYDGEFFYLKESPKGLRVGDDESKIVQLYGEATKKTDGEPWTYYVYDFVTKSPQGNPISLTITVEERKVKDITIAQEFNYGASNGASAW
jgi:hypothetical protein